MARTLTRRPGGATLAELILAFGLLAIVILVLADLALAALRGNEKSGLRVSAEAAAQQELDVFLSTLPPGTAAFWTATSFASPYRTDTVTLGTDSLQRRLDVVDLGAVSPGLRQIVVNVTWWGGQNTRAGYGQQSTVVSRLVGP